MKIEILKRVITSMTILCSLMFPINVSGQSSEKVTDTLVTMVNKIVDDQTVILLDNKDFIIEVSLTDFKNDLDNWLKEHHIEEDEKLLNLVLQQAINEKKVNASKITNADNDLLFRLEFRIASLLENGRCLILNKKSNEIISKVRLQKYIFFIAPEEFSSAGRRFYANEILILQVEDIIS